MRLLLFVLCIYMPILPANEFIQKKRPRRISLNKLKENAANALSCQLRLSAKLMQQIGQLQVKLQNPAMDKCSLDKLPSTSQLCRTGKMKGKEQLNNIGTQLRNYSLQLPDLLSPMAFAQSLHFDANISIGSMLGYITTIMGTVQQHVIKHLEDVFEDKGTVFIKKHRFQLPEVIKTIKLYTKQFHALRDLLSACEKQLVPSATSKKEDVAKNVYIKKELEQKL